MAIVSEHRGLYSVQSICAGLGVGRASYYRTEHPRQPGQTERIHPRALSMGERDSVLGVLNSERFCDQATGSDTTIGSAEKPLNLICDSG